MRKYYIDYLRVLGIIAVITVHVSAHFYTMDDSVGETAWWLANILNSASRFAVPLFVMASGAVLLGRKMKIRDFYIKRSIRILPAILFWTIFYIGFEVYQGLELSEILWFLKVELFVNGRAATHLWYLSMYLCLMLFAPYINMFLVGDKPSFTDLSALLIIVLVFFILNSISSLGKEIAQFDIVWFKSFPWFLAYFIAGYYIDQYIDKLKIKNISILISILLIISLGALTNYFMATTFGLLRESFILKNAGLYVCILTLSIFMLARKNSALLRKNIIISTISEASFGMYLIHPIFIYGIVHNLPNYNAHPTLYMPMVIVLTFFSSLILIIGLRKVRIARIIC